MKPPLQTRKVHDPERVAFLQRYLAQVLRAKQDRARVQGYFVWSLMDNFERGLCPRFGLVDVDFAPSSALYCRQATGIGILKGGV